MKFTKTNKPGNLAAGPQFDRGRRDLLVKTTAGLCVGAGLGATAAIAQTSNGIRWVLKVTLHPR